MAPERSSEDATYHRTLVRACIVLGDETKLAQKLGVPVGHIYEFLLAERPIPIRVFLKAVDVVLSHNEQVVRDSKAFLDEMNRRREDWKRRS